MVKRNGKVDLARTAVVVILLTVGMIGVCMISIGVGHGPSYIFKFLFPIPYALLELSSNKTWMDSLFVFFFLGAAQNVSYALLYSQLKRFASEFFSLSSIMIFHLLMAVLVTSAFE